MVGITQPRRVAAITVATRVAEEMGVEVRMLHQLPVQWKILVIIVCAL